MFLRPNHRDKDGKDHTYWSLVETMRTPDGPRQKTLCYLGELNSSAQARWLTTVEVFNEQGEAQQLKLFPSHVAPPPDDPQVARVLLNKVRLERTRQFGSCFLGLELWKRLELDRFFEQAVDGESADVPWSRVAALLSAIIGKRRNLDASPTGEVDAGTVYGAEVRRMGWSSDSRDRKRGTGSGGPVASGAGL
jgi:hypothetical protein